MDILPALKQMESQLSITCDRVSTLKAKLEDLLFRAQRISAAQKNMMANNDMMFGYDIQHFRREIRAFSGELQSLPTVLGSIERTATYDEKAGKFAQSVMRLCMRLSQSLRALHDMSLLAHQHIRAADHKIEAWYLAQDIEEMVMRGQGLPTSANKIVIATATRPAGMPPPAAGAPPAQA
jgi:hypothetical protein